MTKKDSNFNLDDDMEVLYARTPTPGSGSYEMVDRVPSPVEDEHDLGPLHTSPHTKETSSSSLLPHINFPEVHVPTILERLFNFTDGLKKSTSYTSRYVSPSSPDHNFRVDGSESPVVKKFSTVADFRSQPHAYAPSFREEREAIAGPSRPQVATTSRPNSDNIDSDVLVISHDGRDFTMSDTATSAPSSPRTPYTTRQVRDLPFLHTSGIRFFSIPCLVIG